MKKSLIFALCVFSLLFTLVIFGASADEAATPVSNATEFEAMVTGGNYILTADIDLGGKEYSRYIFAEFHGTIDGDGHTVKNFSIVGTADGYNGMIANANGFLYIKDLNVGTAEAPISVTGEQKASSGTGVLIGYGNEQHNVIISNVDIYANINIAGNYKAMTGGFFAQAENALIEDSSFNGTITVGDPAVYYTEYRNIAAFVGSCSGSALVIKNCVNNANITLAPASKEARAAGFVGYTDRMINLINCTNNGNITVLDLGDQKSGAQLGGIVAHTNHYASVFENCKNNGTLTASSGIGQIVSKASAGAYLVGGTSGANAYSVIDYANSFVYVEGDYTDSIAVGTKEEFLAMTSGKKYHLTADIDLGGVTFEDAIFKGDFSGVVDGKGHKVYNFNLKHVSGDTGIFQRTVERVPFVLINIQFGTADHIINVECKPTSGKSQATVLSGVHANGSAYFKGIDVYADFSTVAFENSVKYAAGGLVAYVRHITIDGCKYYGKFSVGDFTNNVADKGGWKNTGMIGGTVQGVSYVYDCESRGEGNVIVAGGEIRLGGILGYASYAFYMEGCKNYGKISAVTKDTSVTSSTVHIAGILGEANREAVKASNGTTTYYYASGIINGCENFGEIVADNIVAVPIHGGIMGRLRVVNPTAINCNNHVVPVGTNAQELLGVKASGNLTIINFTDAAHQTPETPENPDVTTSGSETTTKPTDDVTTTTPSADTTTVPSGNDTTTVPSDNGTTTAEPADNTTAKPDDTTAKPDDTTAKPDDTTVKTDEPKKKGCGGFAVAAQLIAILGAAITVIAVKKK